MGAKPREHDSCAEHSSTPSSVSCPARPLAAAEARTSTSASPRSGWAPGSACRRSTCARSIRAPSTAPASAGRWRRLGDQHRELRRRDRLGDLQIADTASMGGVCSRSVASWRAVRQSRTSASTRSARGPLDTPLLRELFATDLEQAQRRLVHVPMGRFAEARAIPRGPLARQASGRPRRRCRRSSDPSCPDWCEPTSGGGRRSGSCSRSRRRRSS